MGSSCWRAGREVCRGFMRPWQIGWQESAAVETSRASQNIETRYSILNFHVSLPSNVKKGRLTVGSTNVCHTSLCLRLFGSFPAHFSDCFYMSDSMFTGLFGFACLWFCKSVRLMFSLTAVRLSAWIGAVCVSAACCSYGCCKFAQRCGVPCSCYLSLGVLLWFGIVCLCFCPDYYGMQLAAEPLPVYCPHPGPGIITDITRLFTVWELR